MLADTIRELLLSLLQQDVVVASWGISNIEISALKVSFFVCGFKYNGEVIIQARQSDTLYDIYLGSQVIRKCDRQSIVSLLDSLIESGENYHKLLEDYCGN